MKTIIISIGDELILGQVADTNAAWLSARLVERGLVPEYHQTVPDDLAAIAAAVQQAAARADLVLITGGLGPTLDDLTRQAVARAAGVGLVFHQPSWKKIGLFFKRLGRKMPANNRLQAMMPAGAVVLDNPVGTAPGFSLALRQATIIVLPGVPREMQAMFASHLAPLLAKKSRRKVLIRQLNVFGPGESVVGEKLGELMRRGRNPLVGTTASGGIISVRMRGEFSAAGQGRSAMRQTAAQIKRLLGDVIFSAGDVSLPETVGRLLVQKRKTLATAESCTAGLLAAMITAVPGASRYFLGGWVVYANQMKTRQLAVPAAIIRRAGAVSAPAAEKMAEGALLKSGADYALALTGIAGPRGGAPRKKVGTVWIALAGRTKGDRGVAAEKFHFVGDRASVRDRAAKTALNILRLRLLGK